MDKIELAIVGCGGMGGRHLLGLNELCTSGMCNVELVAACDLRVDNAEYLADQAEKLLGRRPLVFKDMAAMVAALPNLDAVDITTDSGSHHRVAPAALELGLHVLCEKPMALTIRGCNLIIEAWKRSGKVLSVAENYRRDPMNRLVRALLDKGVIGQPYAVFDIGVGGGNQIIILPWRHYKNVGGILIDAGVHNGTSSNTTWATCARSTARASSMSRSATSLSPAGAASRPSTPIGRPRCPTKSRPRPRTRSSRS